MKADRTAPATALRLSVGALILLLAACASPPQAPLPALGLPTAFKASPDRDAQAGAQAPLGAWAHVPPADAEPRGDWWRVFGDPVLDDLERRAMQANTQLQVAAARLAQAQATWQQTEAARGPQVGLVAGASRGTEPGQGLHVNNLGQVAVGLSQPVDWTGRLSLARDAARLDAEGQAAWLQETRLAVQAAVAQTHWALRHAQQEQRLLQETLSAHRDTLALTERRLRAGDVAELDVVRLQAEVATTAAEALAQDRHRVQLEHALATLLGEASSDFRGPGPDPVTGVGALAGGAAEAELPRIPAGVPAAMLARRPDVAAAQRALLAAQARLGVAQTAWFPDLSLTTQGGLASSELGDVLRWTARAWRVEALLQLPLWDGGAREAAVRHAQAGLDLALASHRQQVLQALREVDDQLQGLALLGLEGERQQQAVQAAARATALSHLRYEQGLIGQLEWLEARRSELRSRRAALQVQAARHQATVNRIRALGGGWSVCARLRPRRWPAPRHRRPR